MRFALYFNITNYFFVKNDMNNIFRKFWQAILRHKIITAVVIIVLAGGGYFLYTKMQSTASAQTRYVLATAEKQTFIVSVSGSGQVASSNQIDIKPKASGTVLTVNVSAGQEVKAGTLIARLDSSDAQKTVRDAQSSLDSAKLSLEKLQQPVDQLSLLQSENSLSQAIEAKQKAQNDLVKTYDSGFNDVSNAFLNLPTVMSGLNSILFSSSIKIGQTNIDYYADSVSQYDETIVQYKDDAYEAYTVARASYDKNLDDYKAASRFSSTSTVESLINETYNTTKLIAEAIKSTTNIIQLYQDALIKKNLTPNTVSTTHLASLTSYTATTNTYVSSLLGDKNTIDSSQQSLLNDDRAIAEKTESLANLKAGTDPLDIKSQQLTITQREIALADAKEALANYSVYTPFDGVLASVDIKKGDSASSGASIATIISKQRVAEISLNEVDAASVKTGQKATLTFDAVEDLSISGEVANVDIIGTVSQGVVSYGVKIVFDTQDERIKPGMSVSASIITESKTDVLLVPNSAVKTSGSTYYVLMLDTAQTQQDSSSQGVVSDVSPKQVEVQIGASNDTSTEITSGLKEGDQVVTKTTTSSVSQTSSSSFNLFGIFGGSRNRTTTTSGSTSTSKSTTSNSSGEKQSSGGSAQTGGEMGPPPGF
jgi:HlyD family secretion protein